MTEQTATAPLAAGRCPIRQPSRPVVEFDSHDPAIAVDPFHTYQLIRSTGTVSWTESWGGFWVAAGYHEVATAARSRSLRTAETTSDGTLQGVSIPPMGHTGRLVPLELDVPQSLKYRRLMGSFYSASQVRARIPEFRTLARWCIDEVIESGECDIVDALTLRLPAILTMRDIGIPEQRWKEVDSMLHRALLSAPHDMDTARDAAQLICLNIVEEMEARRDGEAGGLIGHLLGCTVDGVPVSDEDIVSMMYLLLLGIDPTSTLTATALWHLARTPELKARLVANPVLIPNATEEYLRWVSPVQGTSRTAAEDVELGTEQVRAGERVFLTWASANRDERMFDDPASVDIERDASRHVAFGGGSHFCLGAGMVRAMFGVMMEEVLRRLPDYRLGDESAISWFPDLSAVYGICALPISFPPGPRLG